MPSITPAAVLEAVQGGRVTIWALASYFQVAAVSGPLRLALDELTDSGLVVATDPNLYDATLKLSS
jgi:hypothetical protein